MQGESLVSYLSERKQNSAVCTALTSCTLWRKHNGMIEAVKC